VERDSFLRLVEHNSQVALACATLLAHEVTTSFDDVHDLLFAHSSTEKFARLLLSWVSNEEMAQMIGSSRETVTRLLWDRKAPGRRNVGHPNRIALQAIAS